MTPAAGAPLLEAEGITKSFPGVRALHRVHLTLQRGEVLALIGENGAGKSTLMKILAGVQEADAGEIRVDGRPVSFNTVESAMRCGIALIHQELNLASNLDAGSNIFLGREPNRWGWIDEKMLRRQARGYLEAVGLDIAPDVPLESMTLGRQQLVEIAKALSVNARILIMDEPTSSLSQSEAERLFAVIRELRGRGVSVIYISHRLGEVKELAGRVSVLRDGENAGELGRDEIHHDRMVRLMVGRDVERFYQRRPHRPGRVVLEVKGLRTRAYPASAIGFALRAGEIIGMAGLVGAGRSELLQTLFGVQAALEGEIRVDDQLVMVASPRDAVAAGLALVPEDRKGQGLILPMSVSDNLSLVSLRAHRRAGGFRDRKAERVVARDMIAAMRIKTPSDRQEARLLSGGNQQKVVLGKWLAVDPRVLLLDEPTRGIDIGAKQEIYGLMEDLAERGVAVLFVSSEMEEILGMSDRVLVLHEGRLSGELTREGLSEEAIMHLATGGAPAAETSP